MSHRRIHRRFTSEMDEERQTSRRRSTKDQARLNAFLGIVALLLLILFALDAGGLATELGNWIVGRP